MNALIIIDMQVALFKLGNRHDAEGVITRINALSVKMRENNDQVIFIQHDGTEEDGLLPFTAGWEILPSLIKHDSDVIIRKTICDSFYKTELKKTLDNLNVKKITVTGCATDFCVDTTIRSAASLGYNVVVASDCHTTADRPHLKADQIIEHHNWVWKELIVPQTRVEVLPSHMMLE